MAGRTDSGSSITNVAATAGVSIATVSRVLSGKRGKDDDIARRVRAAAEQLGYSVNYAASALRSDVTNTIGLVIPSATEPFAAQLLDEIEPTIDTESTAAVAGHRQPTQAVAGGTHRIAGQPPCGRADRGARRRRRPCRNAEPVREHACRSCRSADGRPRRSARPWSASTKTPRWRRIVKHLAEQGIASAAYMAGNGAVFRIGGTVRHIPHAYAHLRACHQRKLEPVRRTYRAARFRLHHARCSPGRSYSRKPWSAPTMRSRSA